MGSSSPKNDVLSLDNEKFDGFVDQNDDDYIQKNITKIKKVEVNEDLFKKDKKKLHKRDKKLNELKEKDDYDEKNIHEYMFFPVKNKNKDQIEQLAKIKKLNNKTNELYTFEKEQDVKL